MSIPFIYDAIALLGFASPSDEPQSTNGEIVIRYGGWSMQELRDSTIGQQFMHHQQDRYNQYAWSTEKPPSGIYRLRIPVPDSNIKTFAEQQRLLLSGEQAAPIVLVATALLTHRVQTGVELLKNEAIRCKEQMADDWRVALDWGDGRLFVGQYWDDFCYEPLWLASVRTF